MCVTIGVPVYNEEKYIENTLLSLVGQDVERIIISDNASTDRTSEICKRYSLKYSNIEYIRHQCGIAADANFKFCFDASTTPYFMWCGGHDLLDRDHIKKLRENINDDIVLCYCDAKHVDVSYNFLYYYHYAFSSYLFNVDPAVRVYAICRFLTNCTMIHGLFRASALKAAFDNSNIYSNIFLNTDHVMLAFIAFYGKMLHVPDIYYTRLNPREDESHEERYRRVLKLFKNPGGPATVPWSIYKGQLDIIKKIPNKFCSSKKYLELARMSLANQLLPICRKLQGKS